MTILKHRAVLLLLVLAAAGASAGIARAGSAVGSGGLVLAAATAPDGFSDGTDGAIAAPDGFSDGTDGAVAAPDGFSDGTDSLVVPGASAA